MTEILNDLLQFRFVFKIQKIIHYYWRGVTDLKMLIDTGPVDMFHATELADKGPLFVGFT